VHRGDRRAERSREPSDGCSGPPSQYGRFRKKFGVPKRPVELSHTALTARWSASARARHAGAPPLLRRPLRCVRRARAGSRRDRRAAHGRRVAAHGPGRSVARHDRGDGRGRRRGRAVGPYVPAPRVRCVPRPSNPPLPPRTVQQLWLSGRRHAMGSPLKHRQGATAPSCCPDTPPCRPDPARQGPPGCAARWGRASAA
jgi:hypothetical protein